MDALVFIHLNEWGYHVLESWFTDAELRRRYSRPTQTWFEYVLNEPRVYAWMILENGHPVGHLQLDCKQNGTGYFSFLVKPGLRNRGYGKRILRAFLALPQAAKLSCIKTEVEADNLASIRCLQAAGFFQETLEPDADGFLHFFLQRISCGRAK